MDVFRGLVVLLFLAGSASAHQVSSPTENNRYAKITVLPDGVRIAYTVLFGEQPGAIERRRMDRNRDGQIDDAEARAFAEALREAVAPALEVVVDGKPVPAGEWKLAAGGGLGLGLPIVNAGSFALDLVIVARLPDPGAAEHSLWFEDRWPVPNPGETDVKVEESPGCRLLESHVRRDARGIQKVFTFKGAGAAPGDRGIWVRYAVDEASRVVAKKSGGGPPWIMLGVAAAVVIGLVIVMVKFMGPRRAEGEDKSPVDGDIDADGD